VLGFDFVLLALRMSLMNQMTTASRSGRASRGRARKCDIRSGLRRGRRMFFIRCHSLEDSVSRSEWVSSYPAPER
jgi:hypothetical protein